MHIFHLCNRRRHWFQRHREGLLQFSHSRYRYLGRPSMRIGKIKLDACRLLQSGYHSLRRNVGQRVKYLVTSGMCLPFHHHLGRWEGLEPSRARNNETLSAYRTIVSSLCSPRRRGTPVRIERTSRHRQARHCITCSPTPLSSRLRGRTRTDIGPVSRGCMTMVD
jgi:hypothetical protein